MVSKMFKRAAGSRELLEQRAKQQRYVRIPGVANSQAAFN